MTAEQFWNSTMRTINAYIEADRMKMERRDYENWLLGQYFYSAVSTAIDHGFNGRKARSKYVENPFMKEIQEQKAENTEMTEEEKKKQVENFFLRLQIMKSNFDIEKKLKASEENT